jgi:hypothetical protein
MCDAMTLKKYNQSLFKSQFSMMLLLIVDIANHLFIYALRFPLFTGFSVF